MRRFRVGLAQINATVGDFEGNVRKIVDAIERARALGCGLVALPELAITGYPPEDLLFKPAFIEANLRALDEVTRATGGLTAVVGFVDKRDDIFNAAAVLHDGARAGVYHKQYLPNYGVFDENRYFKAGTEAPVFAVGQTTFAVNVCEDIWYPAAPTAVQALAGAELVVNINGSPYHVGKARFREQMVATRAADDLVCVAYVNMVGGQDELVFDGASLIVNEHGECVARGRQFEEDLVVADVDLEAVFRARLHDSRRRKEKLRAAEAAPRITLPPVLRSPEPRPPLPPRDVASPGPVEEVFGALVLGTRDYVRKNGFKGMKEDVTEENLQARIRGNLLMALSNKFGWLVLTTGNKSEYSVGYTTLYGDMAGGFAVIKDVPKMLVYDVARHVNARAGRAVIPETVFTPAHSAATGARRSSTASASARPRAGGPPGRGHGACTTVSVRSVRGKRPVARGPARHGAPSRGYGILHLPDPGSLHRGTVRASAGPAGGPRHGGRRDEPTASWEPGSFERLPASGDARQGDRDARRAVERPCRAGARGGLFAGRI